MRIILLSGGSGKRLWPLSNDVRSKQFLRLLPSPDGTTESMIQRVLRQIRQAGIGDEVTIATSTAQVDPIRSQLGATVDIVTEPSRRDTFPAIVLAAAWLREHGCRPDEPVVVMPCDAFTEEGYFLAIKDMAEAVENGDAELVLMGIEPTSASTHFGYILPNGTVNPDGTMPVAEFIEKPNSDKAEALLRHNAWWNGGVFAFKMSYIERITKDKTGHTDYDWLYEHFDTLQASSFDYEVVEKAASVAMVPYSGMWKDLGTWDALSEELPQVTSGYVVNSPDVRNTHVVNELDLPIVCVGVDNLIVSASPDGILIADKDSAETVKEHVSVIHTRPMFEERRWGYYKVLGHTEYSDGHRTLTKVLHLNPGCSISYQEHSHRNEVWTFVDGEALLVIDDKVTRVGRGYVANILSGQRHAVKALTHVEIIEVQSGDQLVEEDIRRFAWDWENCDCQ